MANIKKKSTTKRGAKKSKKWLPFVFLGGILIAGALVLALRPKPAQTTAGVTGLGPSLQTELKTIDYGTQKLGSTIEVTLSVKNRGDAALIFTQAPYIEVKEGCCPSTPSIGKMVLKPGESTKITFPMMMHTGMGGYHDFRVHLPNNDPKNADFEFVVLSNWVD